MSRSNAIVATAVTAWSPISSRHRHGTLT